MKEDIKNRKGQKIVVQIEEKENPKGIAFVMHGLSGNKEQPHIRTMADAFLEKGYTVILFDTTNTFGESDGQLEDATITNYYEDLEDVIKWSKNQSWYEEPFILAGHSLGGICILLYAEKYPNEVSAIAPISTVVSGELSFKTKGEGNLDEWKEKGIREWKGHSGQMKRLKWSHMEDRLKHDVLKKIDKIRMPILLIVGEHDTSTPVEHQKILYEELDCKKELNIIKGSEHTFRSEEELKELKEYFLKWIDSLVKD
ncbi:alpha/beta fold hydrolase [Candidatus Pacearchaeota archaeon]|nr:alpha/beta fold hydrolase [Candidatus Pacearchaeota archaeon]MBD3283756.1 alpha/beta fold hydrolase [Candidatus Pacearchaeota archaeon]